MTTKDYLNQIGRLNRMINNKLVEIQQLRIMSANISAINTEEKVISSPNYDKMGTAFVKLEEMEEKLDLMIDDFVEKKNHIISQIDGMENELSYVILFSKYIERKSLEKIATELNYSYKSINRYHGTALKEFERKYGEEYLKK